MLNNRRWFVLPIIVTFHNTPVPRKDIVTYLGRSLDTRLTWHIHIQNKVQNHRRKKLRLLGNVSQKQNKLNKTEYISAYIFQI
jgi:hypothetical protein